MSFTSVEGKIAFVSGAASGIGKAMVTRLVKEGAKVVVADIQDELGKKLVEQLNSGKTETIAIYEHTDVTNWNEYLAAFKKTVQVYGRVDIVVNNAGILSEGDCLFNDSDEPPNALKVIDVNLKGVLNGTKLGIRFLKQNGKDGGVIVNTASIAGLFKSPLIPYYCASKFGVVGLSISVASTVIAQNIRINVVAPSAVDTPLLKPYIHTISDDKKVDIGEVIEAFFKLFTNPAYNGEVLAVYPGGRFVFVEKSIHTLPEIVIVVVARLLSETNTLISNKLINQRTYRELITEPIALTPNDYRIINHSELPPVKDELSVTLKINIMAHDPSWATIFHKGGLKRRTPALWLTPKASYAYPRFSITDNFDAGTTIVSDGILLNRWYHMAYTISDSEKRMDFYIDGKWVGYSSIVLVQGEDPTKSNETITPPNGTMAPSNGTSVYENSCPKMGGVLADYRIINHSELPSVKDELSVTLKINIMAHNPSWATVFHKGGLKRRTPSLFLTPNTSHARPRYTITDNYTFGLDMVADGLLLNRWYHMAYTLSDPEKRMDFYIDGIWAGFSSIMLVQVQNVIFNDAPLYIGNDLENDAITGQIRTFRELITDPIALTPEDNRMINHSELPPVKDELSVTLKINIVSHNPSFAAVFHKGGVNGRTPSLLLTPGTSHARPRFSTTDNVKFGIEMVGNGLLLNQCYHMAYTLSDSEKRMDFYIDGEWVGFSNIMLVQGENQTQSNETITTSFSDPAAIATVGLFLRKILKRKRTSIYDNNGPNNQIVFASQNE
ncbi:15811_t:CDS:10 [Funneliformis geosporum]|uniref:15811_t:CDS:1 n=1 Tax=Funneliformis geosporum TaxID=1117311 RepID=A0A9W4SF43_9GLOM|nr:15811_t:CDS:10 [Funneliformis geosporum]